MNTEDNQGTNPNTNDDKSREILTVDNGEATNSNTAKNMETTNA